MANSIGFVNDTLHVEAASLVDIAQRVGTPAFVYSKALLTAQYHELENAFGGIPHRIHYAVKANSNLKVLELFHSLGAGFDIVSGGELSRVLTIGADPSSVIFSGVGKSTEEIDFALKTGIGCFNVESRGELTRILERAELLHCTAPVSIRVNPNVDAQTHPYISTGLKENKFGVTADEALQLYAIADASDDAEILGIDCHIGSQISQAEPLLEALTNLLELVDILSARGIALRHIDLGGGFGICYKDETALDLATYGASVRQILGHRPLSVIIEPGRSLTANAGVLVTRVEYLKPSSQSDAPNFAVIDAAMNDLIRPALYQAWHDVVPVTKGTVGSMAWNIVGPICESGDFIAKDRNLRLQEGDLVAIMSAGAYGMVQASNYNSRDRACEVMVDGAHFNVIRRRENIRDQLRLELEAQPEGSA
jgi:diaminopimelate decarboxylase